MGISFFPVFIELDLMQMRRVRVFLFTIWRSYTKNKRENKCILFTFMSGSNVSEPYVAVGVSVFVQLLRLHDFILSTVA
jgi:O-phosphoseryl-tRNA(Cys) synthetase